MVIKAATPSAAAFDHGANSITGRAGQEFTLGHSTQRSTYKAPESRWARHGHKAGTGWAQSKKPPDWVASAEQLNR